MDPTFGGRSCDDATCHILEDTLEPCFNTEIPHSLGGIAYAVARIGRSQNARERWRSRAVLYLAPSRTRLPCCSLDAGTSPEYAVCYVMLGATFVTLAVGDVVPGLVAVFREVACVFPSVYGTNAIALL